MAVDSLQAQRQLTAELRERDYYNFELYEELTDQSERLAAPMSNEFEYVPTPQGLAAKQQTDDGQIEYIPVRPMLEAGIQAARESLAQHPEWQFELHRRMIELEEWDAIEAFAQGSIDAHELVVFSPHPDEVPDSIDGYDRVRKRTMIRRIRRSKQGVEIRSCSLDQTNHAALQAAAAVIGHELPLDKGADAVLSKRCWLPEPLPEGRDAIDVVREAYDQSLSQQLGGNWYAGRQSMSVHDALAFIKEQPDLIEQHIQTVRQVKASMADLQERAQRLEYHRYNFAAALDKRLRGEAIDAADMATSGDAARAEGQQFSAECPTLTSASEQLAIQGYGREVLCTCPFCGKKVRVDPCASNIKCPNQACNAEVADGKVTNQGKTRQKKLGALALKEVVPPPKPPVQQKSPKKPSVGTVLIMNNRKVQLQQRLVIGGAVQYWVDVKTGETIEKR